ncbi:hypothetical protein EW026_g5015 [Hermanssonia centrifuga]|uniref:3'(2'),5'-bisphosphate nucleotidase n=1 Tax=Hermanssonia centrifuga TaxID=98765 RepID=A0A4S4KGD0_9APHY|nr:hypothetical protein EW026_g5015 [Hermanssonia centrifuga]
MSSPYAAEKQVAVAAVRLGDFSAQAVINTILGRTSPSDPIIGEEDAADMRAESGTALPNRIVELADEPLTAPSHRSYGAWDQRFWTLDPIDGTKGFLRGEQYAVCLALIVDSRVELGVIGCPNLPTSSSSPDERGCVFVAVRHQGAYQLPLSASSPTPPTKLTIPTFSQDTLNFLESVEKAHAKLSFNERVAEVLGVKRAPTRMDSRAKYGALVRGDGGVYLRMPTGNHANKRTSQKIRAHFKLQPVAFVVFAGTQL